jgi:hypothetical protein
MHMRFRDLSLLVGATFLASACSDMSGPNHTLTDAEAAYLAEQMASASLDGVSQSMVGSPGLSPGVAGAPAQTEHWGPVTWERTFTMTRSCPAGGTLTTSGSNKGAIDSTGSGTVEISHILAMADCAHTRDTVTITVNTDPDITMKGTVTIAGGRRTGGTFTKQGKFLWATSDGRSGFCEVNLSITWTGDGNHSMTGTVCGRDFAKISREGGGDR